MKAADMMTFLPDRRIRPGVTYISRTGGQAGQAGGGIVLNQPATVVGLIMHVPVGWHELVQTTPVLQQGTTLQLRLSGDGHSLIGESLISLDGNVQYLVGGDASVVFVPMDVPIRNVGTRVLHWSVNTDDSLPKWARVVYLFDLYEKNRYEATGDHHTLILRADAVTSSSIATAISASIPFPFVLRSAQFVFPTGAQDLSLGGTSGVRMRLYADGGDDVTTLWFNPPENIGTNLLASLENGDDYLVAEDAIMPIPFNYPVYESHTYLKLSATNSGTYPSSNATVIAHIERIIPAERTA